MGGKAMGTLGGVCRRFFVLPGRRSMDNNPKNPDSRRHDIQAQEQRDAGTRRRSHRGLLNF
jgi:hypothetical protein